MGFADFPVEILRALRIKPTEEPKVGGNSQQISRTGTKDTKAEPANISSPAPQVTHANSSATNSPEVAELSTKGELATITMASDTASAAEEVKPGHLHRSSTSSDHTTWSDASPSTDQPVSHDLNRSFSGSQVGQISLEAALEAGKGIGRIVGAGLKSPMDFTLSLARGFHNAPKLYGDESVRQPDKITGIHSGLKAAGKVCFP